MSDNFELTLSFLVVIFLSGVYIVYEAISTPAGGHPFGHALGILGALLMVMTEVLYSARKRWRIFTFGRMRHWLSRPSRQPTHGIRIFRQNQGTAGPAARLHG